MRAEQDKLSIIDAEKEIIGVTHAEVGAYLLGLWGFSHAIIEALAFHHQPQNSTTREFTVLTAVHVVNALTLEIFSTDKNIGKLEQIDTEYIEMLGLASRLAAWRDACPNNQNVPC